MSDRECLDWIKTYLVYDEESESPTLFKVWMAIGTIASALERKCYIKWKRDTIYPNLYIVLTGPPGCRKGTAMRPAKQFLDKIGVNLSAKLSRVRR